MKPEQRPDKNGPKYVLDVQNVHAVINPILIIKKERTKDGKNS